MARFTIYTKDGGVRAYTESLEYRGSWMEDSSVSASIKSSIPVDFAVGDYIEYRGEMFSLDTPPSVQKTARRYFCGDSFIYENITFMGVMRELRNCDFLDFIKDGPNEPIFSYSPNVTFYASTVRDLADRITVNLTRLYTDDEGNPLWEIIVDDSINTDVDDTTLDNMGTGHTNNTYDGAGNLIIRDKVVSMSNSKVYDALMEVKNTFKTTFFIRGRKIVIGATPDIINQGDEWSYGSGRSDITGKGLVTIEKAVNTQFPSISILRACGSTRNLPTRYYEKKCTTLSFPEKDADGIFRKLYGGGVKANPPMCNLIGSTNVAIDILSSNSFRYANYFIRTGVKIALPAIHRQSGNTIEYIGRWEAPSTPGGYHGTSYAQRMFPNRKCRILIEFYDRNGDFEDAIETEAYAYWWRYFGNTESGIQQALQKDEFLLGFTLHKSIDNPGMQGEELFLDDDEKGLFDYYVSQNAYYRITAIDGFDLDYFDTEYKTMERSDMFTLTAFNLMMPGFPQTSLHNYVYGANGSATLRDWIRQCYGDENALNGYLSTDKRYPYIISPRVDEIGKRESSVFFDSDTDDFDEIYPTFEGLTYNGKRVDVLEGVKKENFADNGIIYDKVVDAVEATIPYPGFDVAQVWTSEMTISMKNGMCSGREFTVSKAVSNGETVTLWLERQHDDTLQKYFPNEDYPLMEGDRFVILNIALPEYYVKAASEEVFKQAVLYLSQHDRPSYIITPRVSENFVQRDLDNRGEEFIEESIYYRFKEGCAIMIDDEDLGIKDRVLIVKTLNIKEGSSPVPTFEITIKEDEPLTRLSALEKQVNNLSHAGATTIGASTASTSTARQLSTKLDYGWFEKIFVAYDEKGNRVDPNSATSIMYIKPKVEIRTKDLTLKPIE